LEIGVLERRYGGAGGCAVLLEELKKTKRIVEGGDGGMGFFGEKREKTIDGGRKLDSIRIEWRISRWK
jgi:hypothetical protein